MRKMEQQHSQYLPKDGQFLILFFYISEPVDFTVVKDSTMNKASKSKDGLPREVAINFDVLGNPVNLNLKRNPKVEKAKEFVIRKSEQGIPVIVEDKVIETQVRLL